MRPTTAWQALAHRRFLASAWPWRALAYLASSVPAGLAALVTMAAAVVLGIKLLKEIIGLPLLLVPALVSVPTANIERRRLGIIDTEPAPDPHRMPTRHGRLGWLDSRIHEPATWRDLAYTTVFAILLWPLDLVLLVIGTAGPLVLLFFPLVRETVGHGRTIELLPVWRIATLQQAWLVVPVGIVAVLVAPYLLTAIAGAQGAMARVLLAPREEELGLRLVEVTRSRARMADAFEAERRRIERDLHDGAQQRLVALSMILGLARLSEGKEAAQLVINAHEQGKLALNELRDLIHGIHPQVLTDRGLPSAVAAVADRSPVPADVKLDVPQRLPEAIEAAAYFVVCEALANVAKHSQATSAMVEGQFADGKLVVEVWDNGVGGADVAAGTGIVGLVDRIAVVGGRMMLSSPPGGPTVLRVEIPCIEPLSFI